MNPNIPLGVPESLSDYNSAIWFEPMQLIYSDIIRDQINEAIGRKSDRLVASFPIKLYRDVPYVIEVDLFFPERILPKWAFWEYPSGAPTHRLAEIQFPIPILKTLSTFIECRPESVELISLQNEHILHVIQASEQLKLPLFLVCLSDRPSQTNTIDQFKSYLHVQIHSYQLGDLQKLSEDIMVFLNS